jgi:hypothetical protein
VGHGAAAPWRASPGPQDKEGKENS